MYSSEAYSEPFQASKMELFAKIVNGLRSSHQRYSIKLGVSKDFKNT